MRIFSGRRVLAALAVCMSLYLVPAARASAETLHAVSSISPSASPTDSAAYLSRNRNDEFEAGVATENSPDLARFGRDGRWSQFDLDRLRKRVGHVEIYDPLRDRIIVFGGSDRSNVPFDDTWALSLSGTPTWTRLAITGPRPPARYYHSAVYDPARDRLVIFGGYDGTHRNDVWVLPLATNGGWVQVQPLGTPPAGRWGQVMVYDPGRDRALMMGGHRAHKTYVSDVWELTLAGSPTWTLISVAGTAPVGRNLHSATFDAPRDRMIIFAGQSSFTPRNDLWSLNFSSGPSWELLHPQGTSPSARTGHSMVCHVDPDRLVIFGGFDDEYVADVHELSLIGPTAWSEMAPSAPIPTGRHAAGAALDVLRGRMIVVGGNEGPKRAADVWALDLSGSPSWAEIVPSPSWPVGRHGHALIHDPPRNRVLLIGGDTRVNQGAIDVWEYGLASNFPWRELTPTGVAPSDLSEHAAIYDPIRDRVIVFGGSNDSKHNETWSLSLNGTLQWSQLATIGTPPSPRHGHVAVYESARDRMLVFGGHDGAYLGDIWALSLSGIPTWEPLSPLGVPLPGRKGAGGVVDPLHDRLLIFGGVGDETVFNETWSLDLAPGSSWIPVATSGPTPSPRFEHSTIYDATTERMVVFGGVEFAIPGTNDVWALSLGTEPVWTELLPTGVKPAPRFLHGAAQDPLGKRMMIFGGDPFEELDDVWFLTWNVGQHAPIRPRLGSERDSTDPAPLAVRLVGPNPLSSGRAMIVEYDLPAPGSVISIGIHDVSGRKVATLKEGWSAPGTSRLVWGGSQLDALPNGVYFLRLDEGVARATAQFVFIR